MSQVEKRAKSFISTTKLIQELMSKQLIPSGEKTVRIIFNDFVVDKRYKSKMNVRILRIKGVKTNTIINPQDLFNIAEGINVWLNVKRLDIVSLTKQLFGLEIDLTPKQFTNNKGEHISYFPVSFVKIKSGDENQKMMSELEKEIEDEELKWFNSRYSKGDGEEMKDEVEVDVDMI